MKIFTKLAFPLYYSVCVPWCYGMQPFSSSDNIDMVFKSLDRTRMIHDFTELNLSPNDHPYFPPWDNRIQISIVDNQNKIHKIKKSILSIQNISDLKTAVRPGDWIILDIDKTILTTGKKKYGPNSILLNLDSKFLPIMLDWLKTYPASMGPKKEIKVILLTARKHKNEKDTLEQLAQLGFPTDLEVIFAPNTYGDLSTKGTALVQRLYQSSHLPKRIIMVDDLEENLIDVSRTLALQKDFKNITLKLYQRQTNYKYYESKDQSHLPFPNNLYPLWYLESLSGGTGGVHVLTSKKGKKFTFKSVTNSDQIKEEILADALYRSLGILVPAFAVYDHPHWSKEVTQACTGPGPYRLAHFIFKHADNSFDVLKKELCKHFVADAFLSNWDIVIGDFKNVILDFKGQLWRIDNGGSLRYRALGDRKITGDKWDPFKVTELETMRDPNINKSGALVYADLKETDLKAQAQAILNKRDILFSTFDHVSSILHVNNPEEVREMFLRRLDNLVQRFSLVDETPVVPRRFSLSAGDYQCIPRDLQEKRTLYQKPLNLSPTLRLATEKSAAGILIYSTDPKTKETVILSGQRIGHKWWGNFGGKSDVNIGENSDKTLADTAVREVQEESLGLLSFTAMELSNWPSHDIVNKDGILYRMYIAYHPYRETAQFEKANSIEDYHWKHEYSKYFWLPLQHLIEGLNEEKNEVIEVIEEGKETIKIGNDLILHPPFLEMLRESEVMDLLLKIQKNQKCAPRHTQRKETITHRAMTLDEKKAHLANFVVKYGELLGELKQNKTPLKTAFTKTPQTNIVYKAPITLQEKWNKVKCKDVLISGSYYVTSEDSEGFQNEIYERPYIKISNNKDLPLPEQSEIVLLMKGRLSNEELISYRELLLKAPYTQTEIYLSSIMKLEDFEKVKGDCEAQVKVFLDSYSKYRGSDCLNDAHYRQVLKLLLEAEKIAKNTGKIVFYHATDPMTCFMFDLVTIFRSHLKMVSPDQNTIFRAIDSSFKTILDIDAFISFFKKDGGKIYNYEEKQSIHYADMGMSVNLFLFGNDGNDTSSSYWLFNRGQSVDAPDHEKLFNAFMAAAGISAQYKDYKALFQQYYLHSGQRNSKIYQIFVDLQIVDSVAYTAVSGGDVVDITMDDQSLYHGISRLFVEGCSTFGALEKRFNGGKSTKHSNLSLNDLQARLYLKPEIFHNPAHVTTKSYWRHEVSKDLKKIFYDKLRAQVSQDLSKWLQSHSTSDNDVFEGGVPKLKKLYQNIHKDFIGIQYREIESLNMLPIAILRGNVGAVENIMKKNSKIDLNKGVPNLKYRKHQGGSKIIPVWDLIAKKTPNVLELVSLLLDNGLEKNFNSLLLFLINLKKDEVTEWGSKLPRMLMEVQTIDLKGQGIGDVGAINLAAFLREKTMINSIDLYSNNITDHGTAALAEGLKENTTLTSINLSHNNITSTGTISLTETLKVNKTITSINLNNNQISDEGAASLAEMLKTNTTVSSVYLNHNQITDSGAAAFVEMFKTNATIMLDCVGNCKIGFSSVMNLLPYQDRIPSDLWQYINTEERFIALIEALKNNLISLTTLNLQGKCLRDGKIVTLVEMLRTNTTITSVNLSDNAITNAAASFLAEMLKQNTTITSIDLSNNRFTDVGAESLIEMLKINLKIRLDLHRNNIDFLGVIRLLPYKDRVTQLLTLDMQTAAVVKNDSDVIALAEAIKLGVILATKLEISGRNITDTGVIALAEALKSNTTITSLNLSKNKISDLGERALIDMLQSNVTITSINLNFNQISFPNLIDLVANQKRISINLWDHITEDASLIAFSNAIKENMILPASLELSGKNITDVGISSLAEGLKINTSTTSVDLSKNKMTDVGVASLTKVLKKNTTLEKLLIRENLITDDGASALAEELHENKGLQELSLWHNKISDLGAQKLGEMLMKNTTLRSLTLSKNEIGDQGAISLAEALKHNSTLTLLKLGRNIIKDEGIATLLESLTTNTHLTILKLERNELSDGGLQHLEKILNLNQTLKSLYLNGKNISTTMATDLKTKFGNRIMFS